MELVETFIFLTVLTDNERAYFFKIRSPFLQRHMDCCKAFQHGYKLYSKDEHFRLISVLGLRKEIIPQYGVGFWFFTQAHPSAHIGICGGGCNAGDGPTDKQDEELFLSEALSPVTGFAYDIYV